MSSTRKPISYINLAKRFLQARIFALVTWCLWSVSQYRHQVVRSLIGNLSRSSLTISAMRTWLW